MSDPPEGRLQLLGNRSGPAFSLLAARQVVVAPRFLPERCRPSEPRHVNA
ncbi:hypothetical protein Sinac_2661 [Singulisphaera acidiphila DSM 18658]|uniref:Uncharacterized protein n=1 Tax=Singulisphaera acidiphila (strain ATCC BAA-1392 / DSM 18658 / VKM B-2454 / MOB10) TaxID=886293 RepID=L0DDR1_SINAD|nr:hypothetical protein Sinac_2661 [Singulisphaera acidiphila DSM 18658]